MNGMLGLASNASTLFQVFGLSLTSQPGDSFLLYDIQDSDIFWLKSIDTNSWVN
jgi:hypothetical protein